MILRHRKHRLYEGIMGDNILIATSCQRGKENDTGLFGITSLRLVLSQLNVLFIFFFFSHIHSRHLVDTINGMQHNSALNTNYARAMAHILQL